VTGVQTCALPISVALRTGFPSVALVLIDGVTGVTLRGLTVDGSAASLPAECPPYFGVFYRQASGTLDSVRVTGIVPCVSVGIFVQSPVDGSGRAKVAIHGSAVDNYGLLGIICNELGTDCTISNNTIVGRGDVPDAFTAGGIQIAYGAVGRVTDNVVRENLCTVDVCGPDPLTQFQAAGIVAFGGQDTVISDNKVSDNDAGIYVAGPAGCCTTTENRLTDNRFFGIAIQDGSNTTSENEIVGGNYGIVAVAFSVDTVATSRGDRIRGAAIAPTAAFSCCGVTAQVVRVR